MFKELNPLLHSELRLGIMSILISVEEADFLFIKEKTGATPGNISVQLEKLSGAGYLKIEKGFLGKRTRTVCKITPDGTAAFSDYVEALKSYLEIKT